MRMPSCSLGLPTWVSRGPYTLRAPRSEVLNLTCCVSLNSIQPLCNLQLPQPKSSEPVVIFLSLSYFIQENPKGFSSSTPRSPRSRHLCSHHSGGTKCCRLSPVLLHDYRLPIGTCAHLNTRSSPGHFLETSLPNTWQARASYSSVSFRGKGKFGQQCVE